MWKVSVRHTKLSRTFIVLSMKCLSACYAISTMPNGSAEVIGNPHELLARRLPCGPAHRPSAPRSPAVVPERGAEMSWPTQEDRDALRLLLVLMTPNS
jgi:hypothetical protein